MGNSFLEKYKSLTNAIDAEIKNIQDEVCKIIKEHNNDVWIGNMIYRVIEWEGNELPGYCYQSDFKKGNIQFYPLFDKDKAFEFGYCDFKDCCRIFDEIKNRLS